MKAYVDDLYAKDMLHAVFLRSSIAAGSIESIVLPEDSPDTYGVISFRDIPGENSITVFQTSMPILAQSAVEYQGQPILIIYGPSETGVREFVSQIQVEYREDEPKIFDGYAEDQIIERKTLTKGKTEISLEDSFQIIEGTYTIGTVFPHASDPVGAYTWTDGTTLYVRCPSQWLFHVQDSIATVLNLPKRSIIVQTTCMSPPYNSKLWYPSYIGCCAALITYRTGKSVRFLLSDEEELRYGTKQAPMLIEHRTGLNKEGNPQAMEISINIDTGAYSFFSTEVAAQTTIGAGGVYACRNVQVETTLVKTNAPPMDSVYGLGLSHAFLATETHFSRIAEILQTDPSDWKSKNILKKGNSFITGGALAEDSPESILIDYVAKKSDFKRKHAAYEMIKKRKASFDDDRFSIRGIGLSAAFQGSGLHGRNEEKYPYSVLVRLDTDGKVTILTSATSGRPYIRKVWIETASSILGIDTSLISIGEIDTSIVPDSGPSAVSRNIFIITKLVERCCQTIQKKRFRTPLPIEVKRNYRLPKTFRWDERSFSGKPFPTLSWGASVVEVELDPVSFEASIRGIWMAIDCGKIHDEEAARKSVGEETLHVLDWIASGGVGPYSGDGLNWKQYTIDVARLHEMMSISVDFLATEKQPIASGLGELPANLIPAAYVSAVSQATGLYIDSIPVTPELIFKYMEEQ